VLIRAGRRTYRNMDMMDHWQIAKPEDE